MTLTVAELRELLHNLRGDLIVYVETGSEIAQAISITHDSFEIEEGPAIVITGAE